MRVRVELQIVSASEFLGVTLFVQSQLQESQGRFCASQMYSR